MARRLGLLFVVLGLGAFTLAAWGLWYDVGWLAEPFYAYVWWSYILILDGFCALRRGHSLLASRTRFVLPIAFWSVSFWFCFEVLNLRFQNWYYVGVLPARTPLELAGGGLFVFLCFATVFMGLFETQEALAAAGLGRSWRGRPGKLPAWVSHAVQAVGVTMAALAILFPTYLAPLIWGSFTFIVDPWNYRRGARSVLRDFEAREWGMVARLFLAGLICGLVWESLNFFAPQKWIYTVRGLEELKLFEMPLLGFLGFPALAFDAFAAFSLLAYLVHGNVLWENPADCRHILAPRPRPSRPIRAMIALLQPGCWALIAVAMEPNIGSIRTEIQDLGLTRREVSALQVEGIARPRQLLLAAAEPGRREEISRRLGWSQERLEQAVGRAEMSLFKGIGPRFAALLDRAGIRRVEDLRGWSPPELQARLAVEANRLGGRAPRLDMVRVWVLASRHRGILMTVGSEDGDGRSAGP